MSDAVSSISAAEFRARVRQRGAIGELPDVGDHILNPDLAQLMERPTARAAAVLVPVVDRPEGASVVLTVRAETLRKHAGQIAFPGGTIDPTDVSAEAAALREAEEEIGLTPDFVEVVGRLPSYSTGSGFRITPVLSVVRPGFHICPSPHEVADVFEVPLGFLMDSANHARATREFGGHTRHFYVIPFGERRIWGITAGILRTLYERLYQA